MALIICDECGQQISDTAEVCIHCGAPRANTPAESHYSNDETLNYWNNLGQVENAFDDFRFPDDDAFIEQERFDELSAAYSECAPRLREFAQHIASFSTDRVDAALTELGRRRAQWFRDLADNYDGWASHFNVLAEHYRPNTGFRARVEGAIRGAFGDPFGKRSEALASVEALRFEKNRLQETFNRINSESDVWDNDRHSLQDDLIRRYRWTSR